MVCPSVCPRGYLRNHTRDLYQIFVHVAYVHDLVLLGHVYDRPHHLSPGRGFLPHWKCIIGQKRGWECAARAKYAIYDCLLVSCAKTAEPIQMPFGTWTRVSARNHVLDGGAHWHHLANTSEPSACGGNASGPYVQLLWPLVVAEDVPISACSKGGLDWWRPLAVSFWLYHAVVTVYQVM